MKNAGRYSDFTVSSKHGIFTIIAVVCILTGSCFNCESQGVDRDRFFNTCLVKFPKTFSSPNAVVSINKIFDYWEHRGYQDRRWLAYILGTAYRETVGRVVPVREGLCSTDECAMRAVASYALKNHKKNYAMPDSNGHSYFGRGFVQLTSRNNYKRVDDSLRLGNELVEHPESALELEKAVIILVEGCVQGLFTRHKLSDYFNDKKNDWIGARAIVNPGSKRAEITARHAQDFFNCLQ